MDFWGTRKACAAAAFLLLQCLAYYYSRKIQLCRMEFWLWYSVWRVWPSSYTNWLSRPELIYVRDILQNGCVKLHLLSQSQFFGIPTRWRLVYTNSNQSSRYTYLVQIGWPPASDMYLTDAAAKLQTWFIFFCHDWSNLFGRKNWENLSPEFINFRATPHGSGLS